MEVPSRRRRRDVAPWAAAMPFGNSRHGDRGGQDHHVQAVALGLDRYDPDAIHRKTLERRTAEDIGV